MSHVTQLLNAIEAGEPKAADQLLPLVYEELRKLAVVRMGNEKAGQTLQPRPCASTWFPPVSASVSPAFLAELTTSNAPRPSAAPAAPSTPKPLLRPASSNTSTPILPPPGLLSYERAMNLSGAKWAIISNPLA